MKQQIFNYIDNSKPLVLDLEDGLTSRPAISPESGGEGEIDKCIYLEGWLKAHGIMNLERYDAPDKRAKGGIRPNLVATIPGKNDAKRLWIMSHLDVVPPGDMSLWNSDPWKMVEKDGKLYGRGIEDNQQGLVSSVIAVLSLLDQGITPAHTVKLLFAADEENGSEYGIDWLVKNTDLFRKDDMVLIPDGGSPDGTQVVIAEKNVLWMTFHTKGIQSHGSRPDQGANASLAGSALAVRLYEGLNAKFDARDPLFEPSRSTFEPTKKEANVPNINTIPGEDSFSMDMRILPCYPNKTVLAEIDRIIAEVEAKYKVTITYTLAQSGESVGTSPDAPIVKILAKLVKDIYKVDTKAIGIGGGTVGAFLRNIGIDSIVWSRMDDTAHQPNEYTIIENLLGDAKVMALFMMEEQ
jgi:succinyl-diaminopimelate desuccinylase